MDLISDISNSAISRSNIIHDIVLSIKLGNKITFMTQIGHCNSIPKAKSPKAYLIWIQLTSVSELDPKSFKKNGSVEEITRRLD